MIKTLAVANTDTYIIPNKALLNKIGIIESIKAFVIIVEIMLRL